MASDRHLVNATCRDLEVANSARGHGKRVVLTVRKQPDGEWKVKPQWIVWQPVTLHRSVWGIVGDAGRMLTWANDAPAFATLAFGLSNREISLSKYIWTRRACAFRHGWRLLAIAAAMAAAFSVHAQTAAPLKKENAVTLYGGYRAGGNLTDENTGSSVSVRNDASYALAVDIGLDRQTQAQLFYSHQKTALSSGSFAPTLNNEGLVIDYYHVGGTYFFEEVGRGGYVAGGFGATHVSPDRGDLNSETFLSGNIGMGFMLPLGKHAGLRLEVRGYATLINNDSALFCSDNVGCVAAINGDALYQGEALVGLSIRF